MKTTISQLQRPWNMFYQCEKLKQNKPYNSLTVRVTHRNYGEHCPLLTATTITNIKRRKGRRKERKM
jgi:hypothetical protein